MYHVAPLVGAWIEITVLNLFISHLLSLLSWERGLKSALILSSIYWNRVAPLVGAWIEIIVSTTAI